MPDPANPGAPRYEEPPEPSPFGPPPPVQPPAERSGCSGALTTVVVVLGLLVLTCLLLPAVAGAFRNAKTTACVNNLSHLWKLQNDYRTRFGGPDLLMPPDTGEAFWWKLTTVAPPLIDPTRRDILACPVKGQDQAPGTIDYRGPRMNVNFMDDGDIVGADHVGNHGENEGGSVLRKSGDVQTAAETDPLWVRAAATTHR